MNTYTPDNWVILKMTSPDDVCYKVLAGWYGGYTTGDSWKLSSGIIDITSTDSYFLFPQHSGSTYLCHKSQEKLSMMTSSMLDGWLELAKKHEGEGVGIVVVSPEELVKDWHGK